MVAKVRTGCITCKRRHVKCDESKPGCQRCIKWRGHCDGYEDGRTKSRTPESGKKKSQTSPTTPTTGEQEKVRLPRWYSALTAESNKLLIGPDYERDSKNSKGLSERKKAAIMGSTKDESAHPGLSGFDDTFWKAAVPYLLRQNAAVWYSNLAIHALVDAKKPTSENEGGGGGGGGNGGSDNGTSGDDKAAYRRALRYHGLALGQLRKEAINRDTLQSATLCCLFFVIFEMLNGDEKAAQAHMYNGCKMLDELQRDNQAAPMSNAEVDATLHREIRKALNFVAMQLNGASQSRDTVSQSSLQSSLPPSPLAWTVSSEGMASEATSSDEWFGFGL